MLVGGIILDPTRLPRDVCVRATSSSVIPHNGLSTGIISWGGGKKCHSMRE